MLLFRKRHIDSLLLVARFSLLSLELLVHLVKFALRPVLDLVDHLTVVRLELLRDLAHLLHERADLSFFGIHDTLLVLIDTLAAGDFRKITFDLTSDLGKLFLQFTKFRHVFLLFFCLSIQKSHDNVSIVMGRIRFFFAPSRYHPCSDFFGKSTISRRFCLFVCSHCCAFNAAPASA